ncbi:hypothetical protein JOD54_002421 [Actinokineospora baliensis]|uniref:hypothetical protein n=1 Tax=Actinokineospora baliensis TaxID=547056 RepID=UPI001958C995|nr:hypothetical protein [Actinokineospora baliensis]MBM7772217.1 hypothetical protein [Actinokineospora baliensis]
MRSLVLFAVLLSVLTGCGGVGSDKPSAAEFRDAKALGDAIRTTAMRETTVLGTFSSRIGEDALRNTVAVASVRAELNQPGPRVEVDLEYQSKTWTVVAVGADTFLKEGESNVRGPWKRLDVATATESDFALAAFGTGIGTLDPRHIGTATSAASTLVETEPDRIGSTAVVRYRVEVVAAELDSGFGLSETGVGGIRTDTFLVDLWVEPGGRLVRFEARFGPHSSDFVFLADYTAWSSVLYVNAPEAGEVEPG